MASLISKASLLMVPSVYEDGTLYNVLPSGNKAPDETGNHNGYDQTRADFTFSRGSNLAATRVNADGLIEKGRENLLLQSNQFDTTWVAVNSSVTSGQSGYDNTNDAWLLTATSSGANIYQLNSSTGVLSLSIYAKANASNWIRLRFDNSPSADVNTWVNLTDGSIGSDGGIATNVESVGGGWYRITAQTNTSDLNNVRIYPADSDGNNSTSGSIYIQNAQLEKGLVSTAVMTSGATTATAGVLENTPRIDYSSGAGALLLEPQRTNSVLHSEFISTYFFFTNASASNNQTTSPEGVVNAASIIPDATSGMHQIASSNISASGSFTLSAFVKAGELNKVAIRESNATGAYASFNLSTGTKIEDNVSGDAFIEPFENDWYRIGVTYTHSGNIRLGINILDNSYTTGNPSSGTNYWSSNGTDKLYVYGLQCELGASYPSSYVPTYGSAATRGADSCSVTGASDVIGQTEGTLFFDWNYLSNDGNYDFRFNLSDGTGITEWIFVGMTNADARAYVTSGGSIQFDSNDEYDITIGNRYKMALAYANNDFAFYINGTQVATSSSGSVPTGMDNIMMSNQPNVSGSVVKNSVNQTALFDTRLTNSELAALTA